MVDGGTNLVNSTTDAPIYRWQLLQRPTKKTNFYYAPSNKKLLIGEGHLAINAT